MAPKYRIALVLEARGVLIPLIAREELVGALAREAHVRTADELLGRAVQRQTRRVRLRLLIGHDELVKIGEEVLGRHLDALESAPEIRRRLTGVLLLSLAS